MLEVFYKKKTKPDSFSALWNTPPILMRVRVSNLKLLSQMLSPEHQIHVARVIFGDMLENAENISPLTCVTVPRKNLGWTSFSGRTTSPASASCSSHPLLPSSPYLLFIIPFLRDYILLAWDGGTWTFHIPSEFLRTGQVSTVFLITGNIQPSFMSCTLKVYSSFPTAGLSLKAIELPTTSRES